jgi:hypothetical protein
MDDSIWIAIIGQNLRQILDPLKRSTGATAASLRRYSHFRRQNRPQFFFHDSLEIQMQVGYILSLNRFPKRLRYFFAPMAQFSG